MKNKIFGNRRTNRFFIVLFMVWIMDCITTAFALSFVDRAYESNSIASWFFSYGIYGWILWIGIGGLILYMLIWFVLKLQSSVKYKNNWLISFCGLGLFLILEGYAIVNNLVLILE